MATPRTSLRLSAGEQVLRVMHTHPKVLFPQVALLILLIILAIAAAVFVPADWGSGWVRGGIWIALAVAALILCGWPMLLWASKYYTLTNRQIVSSWGIIAKNTHSTQLSRVSDLRTERGMLDRMFGCGTLVIENAASGVGGTSQTVLKDVPGVLDIEATIKDLINAAP